MYGWTKFTTDLQGSNSSKFGDSIAISQSGKYLVVGAPGDRSSRGSIFVYERDGDYGWNELTNRKIENNNNTNGYSSTSSDQLASMQFGSVVAVNENATIIAVSSPYWAPPGEYIKGGAGIPGMVQIYQLQSDNTYSQIGQDLIGSQGDSALVSQLYGSSISLSSDVYRIAIGDRNYTGISEGDNTQQLLYSGRVQVFDYNIGTNNWDNVSSKYNVNKRTTGLTDNSTFDSHIESDLTI